MHQRSQFHSMIAHYFASLVLLSISLSLAALHGCSLSPLQIDSISHIHCLFYWKWICCCSSSLAHWIHVMMSFSFACAPDVRRFLFGFFSNTLLCTCMCMFLAVWVVYVTASACTKCLVVCYTHRIQGDEIPFYYNIWFHFPFGFGKAAPLLTHCRYRRRRRCCSLYCHYFNSLVQSQSHSQFFFFLINRKQNVYYTRKNIYSLFVLFGFVWIRAH